MMKIMKKISALSSILTLLLATRALAQQSDPASFEDLERQVLQHRAIEAVIWGMPAVNRDLMYQAMLRETKGRDNQMFYWSRLLDWKNQTLTPNTDVIYLTPHFDTKEVGPVVMEIPPADGGAIVGTIMDAWQTPLEDVGPAGAGPRQGRQVPDPSARSHGAGSRWVHCLAIADLQRICPTAVDSPERERGGFGHGG